MRKYKIPSYEHDRQIAEEIGLCPKRKNKSISVSLPESRINQLKWLVKQAEHQHYYPNLTRNTSAKEENKDES